MNKGHLNDLVGISYTHPYEEPSAPCTKIEKRTSTTIATASFEELAKAITMSPSNKRTIDCQPNRPRIPEEQSKEGLVSYKPHTIKAKVNIFVNRYLPHLLLDLSLT